MDTPLGAQISWLGPQAPACHQLGLTHCPGSGSLAAVLCLGPPLECPRGLSWKWEESLNSQGGGIGSNRLLLPRGPRAPVLGPASEAPGCLGTFPNKHGRASSLSGKHGLPLPPPYSAILANSAQWELCGANVWPGCQDTWGEIPYLSHRELGKPLSTLDLLLHPYTGSRAMPTCLGDQMGGTELP